MSKIKKEKSEERSVGDILTGKPITIKLGQKKYPIVPQVRNKSREFRKACGMLFDGLDDLAIVMRAVSETAGKENVGLEKVVVLVRELIGEKADAALDLIYVYDEGLEEDREYIDAHATDGEMLSALSVILRLVFRPFLRVIPADVALTKAEKSGEQSEGG